MPHRSTRLDISHRENNAIAVRQREGRLRLGATSHTQPIHTHKTHILDRNIVKWWCHDTRSCPYLHLRPALDCPCIERHRPGPIRWRSMLRWTVRATENGWKLIHITPPQPLFTPQGPSRLLNQYTSLPNATSLDSPRHPPSQKQRNRRQAARGWTRSHLTHTAYTYTQNAHIRQKYSEMVMPRHEIVSILTSVFCFCSPVLDCSFIWMVILNYITLT